MHFYYCHWQYQPIHPLLCSVVVHVAGLERYGKIRKRLIWMQSACGVYRWNNSLLYPSAIVYVVTKHKNTLEIPSYTDCIKCQEELLLLLLCPSGECWLYLHHANNICVLECQSLVPASVHSLALPQFFCLVLLSINNLTDDNFSVKSFLTVLCFQANSFCCSIPIHFCVNHHRGLALCVSGVYF